MAMGKLEKRNWLSWRGTFKVLSNLKRNVYSRGNRWLVINLKFPVRKKIYLKEEKKAATSGLLSCLLNKLINYENENGGILIERYW